MVIYLVTNTYFNDRDHQRYGVDFFLKKGHKVIVLDVQDYINPKLYKTEKPSYSKHPNLNVIVCTNLKMIEKTLKHYNSGIAFLFVGCDVKSIKIKNLLYTNNIKIGIIDAGFLPKLDKNTNIYYKIINRFFTRKISYIVFALFNKLYKKLYDKYKFDFLITANKLLSEKTINIEKVNNIITTHALDYDLAIENEEQKRLIDNKYIVFIDQNLPFHSDFIRVGSKIQFHAEKYIKELDRFFDLMEEKYNCPVIISAHPRANIELYKKFFSNRHILIGQTQNLIRYSEFIIAHYSTAINFAVIYNKPILFVITDEIQQTYINYYVKNFSLELGQPFINISLMNISQLNNLEINPQKYRDYYKTYIKTNNLQKNTFEIFYDHFLSKLK